MKKRYLFLIAGLCLAMTGISNADILWRNDSDTLITDHDGSALTSSATDATVGCFAQLIKASGSTASAFDRGNSYGVSGGDSVVDNNYTRQGTSFPPLDGLFPEQTYAAGTAAGYYYVRVFNAAADSTASYAAMTVPSAATYYFESTVFSYAGGDPPPASVFSFAQGLSGEQLRTSHAIVPEPTTLAFLGLGVVAFIVRKRVRG